MLKIVDAVKVSIDPTDGNPSALGFATIEIPNLLKICRIKIRKGHRGYYCLAPTESYTENGVKKWTNIVTFDKPVWDKLQEKIIEEYKKQCSEAKE